MNRVLLVAAAVALFGAAACGGDDDDSDVTPADGTAAVAPTIASDATPLPAEVQTAIASQTTPGASTEVQFVDTTVAIDADPSTDEIDSQGSHAIGSEFTVVFALTEAGGEYQGYQFDIMWDPAVLSYVSVNHLKPENLETCSPTRTFDNNRVGAFCVDTQLEPKSYTGQLSEVTFKCDAVGQSVLHLRAPEEGNPGTKVENSGQPIEHVLTRIDATISCE